jgi:RNA polymerase sigma factor (sigma-70 family)
MTTPTISHAPANATDTVADLLHGMHDGNPEAWNEILRRYGRLVSTTVRSFRLQEADTLDAIQMTWLRLAENTNRIQFPERLGGWLATTARRECLRILNRIKRTPDLADVVPETAADPSTGPEQRAIDADTAQMLWTFVDELPPRRRTVIRMLFTDDSRSYAAIANVAGIPAGGIGPTRARALRQLRNKLNEHEQGSGRRHHTSGQHHASRTAV